MTAFLPGAPTGRLAGRPRADLGEQSDIEPRDEPARTWYFRRLAGSTSDNAERCSSARGATGALRTPALRSRALDGWWLLLAGGQRNRTYTEDQDSLHVGLPFSSRRVDRSAESAGAPRGRAPASDLARLFQRGGALLRDLELLRLHRLARLQREQLVGGLRRLQRTDG